jgi:hypothetical protein
VLNPGLSTGCIPSTTVIFGQATDAADACITAATMNNPIRLRRMRIRIFVPRIRRSHKLFKTYRTFAVCEVRICGGVKVVSLPWVSHAPHGPDSLTVHLQFHPGIASFFSDLCAVTLTQMLVSLYLVKVARSGTLHHFLSSMNVGPCQSSVQL